MPLTVEQALARARDIILETRTHPDYQRTVQYAKDWHDLQTGNIARFLERFTARESESDFLARLKLTVTTLPALIAELRGPFYKVSRLKGAQVDRRFEYDDNLSEAERARRVEALLGALDTYYAGRPFEDYLSETIVRSYALSDPNAWLLTDFAPFDFRTQRAKPYPVILPSSAVVDFTREAGVVSSLTARLSVTAGDTQAWRYTVYLENEALDFWPVVSVGGVLKHTMPEGSVVVGTVQADAGPAWEYRILRHRAGRVPASVLGYVPDAETYGRTFASPLEPAMAFLMEELHSGSEMGIVMKRIWHPHKSQYVPECTGYENDGGCSNGMAPRLNGGTDPGPCRRCNGTSVPPIAVSASDVATFPLPKNPLDLAKLPKLGDMVDFKTPPIEIPEFRLKYSEHLRQRCWQVLFNRDAVQKTTGEAQATATATERLQQNDRENVALSPFADWFSTTYVHHGFVSASYSDVADGLRIFYGFPKDLIPPELSDLVAAYDSAVKAGVGPELLKYAFKRMVRQELAGSPEELRKIEVQWRFVSYVGIPRAWFIQDATLNYIPAEARTLRLEQDRVFSELEYENPDFYRLSQKAQQPLVDAKVKAIMTLLAPAGPGSTFRTPDFSTKPVPAEPVAA